MWYINVIHIFLSRNLLWNNFLHFLFFKLTKTKKRHKKMGKLRLIIFVINHHAVNNFYYFVFKYFCLFIIFGYVINLSKNIGIHSLNYYNIYIILHNLNIKCNKYEYAILLNLYVYCYKLINISIISWRC